MFRYALMSVLLFALGGCASTPSKLASSSESESSFSTRFAKLAHPFGGSPFRSRNRDLQDLPRWDWVPALPQNLARGELVTATISREAITRLAPDLLLQPIRLASSDGSQDQARVVNVGGKKVAHFADLSVALDRALETGQPVQVDLALNGSSAKEEIVATTLEPAWLVSFCQQVAPEAKIVCVTEAGNPWVVIRDGGVQCKMTARVERNRGLLHLVLSLTNSSGEELLLPGDVRAKCNGCPLRCLTAADTLQLLYGSTPADTAPPGASTPSFAAISEREDYLIPTNYKELEARFDELYRTSAAALPSPALASVAGEAYPGPALLGDARALTIFLMQRQRMKSGDKEATGWIMCSGPEIQHGGLLEIEIDFPSGPHRIQFSLTPSIGA